MLKNNYTPKSTYIDTHRYSLSELLVQVLQAIEALKDDQASLCGGIE